jgi:hypothetical protein
MLSPRILQSRNHPTMRFRFSERRVDKGAKRRAHAFPAIQSRGLRRAQPALPFVTTGLDPVVHAHLSTIWIAESFDIKTALRAFCPAMTS